MKGHILWKWGKTLGQNNIFLHAEKRESVKFSAIEAYGGQVYSKKEIEF